jgi:hypothetical protein
MLETMKMGSLLSKVQVCCQMLERGTVREHKRLAAEMILAVLSLQDGVRLWVIMLLYSW